MANHAAVAVHPARHFDSVVRDGQMVSRERTPIAELYAIVTRDILTEYEYAKRVDMPLVVAEYHVSQLASNPRMEDRHSVH